MSAHLKAPSASPAARLTPESRTRLPVISAIESLHRCLGNVAMRRYVQARLSVSRPDDPYELEADRVAEQVLRMRDPAAATEPAGTLQIQRLGPACEEPVERLPLEEDAEKKVQTKALATEGALPQQGREEEEEPLQRQAEEKGAPKVSAEVEAAVHSLPGHGVPLPEPVRAFMEPRFRAGFSGVRIHTGAYAHDLARAVNAQAFTVGRDVVFGAGHYAPDTEGGRRLLAHELTHVVQQDSGVRIATETQAKPVDALVQRADQPVSPVSAAQAISGLPTCDVPHMQFERRRPVTQPSGEENEASVTELLQSLRRRLPRAARSAPLGRIIGDELRMAGGTYPLALGAVRSPEGEGRSTEAASTVSARLGTGTFYLNPTPRSRASVLALAEGGVYEVVRVATDGSFSATGYLVVTRGLEAQPAGLLVYTTRVIHLAEVGIDGRLPRDTQAVAQRVLAFIDQGPPIWMTPGISAMFLIEGDSLLAPLNHDELMEVFQQLERAGRLGELFNLVSAPRFRSFLRQREIAWQYVFQNWDSSPNDRLAIFAGVLVGAGENFYQVLELIGIMIGSVFSESLARQRQEFFDALSEFFQHPVMTAETGLRMLRDTFMEKLWQLEFFDAGRIIGNAAITILTLPAAIRSIPQLARNLARMAVRVARITLAAVEQLGVALADVARFALRPLPGLVTDSGYILMMSGDDILLLGGRGQPSARIPRAEVLRGMREGRVTLRGITDAEIEAALARLDELAAEARATARAGTVESRGAASAARGALSVADLEAVVQDAIVALREALGEAWISNREFGTRLHAIVSDLIRERFTGMAGVTVTTEESIRAFGRLPPRMLNQTVEDFVRSTAGLREYADELRPLFTRTGEGGSVPRLVGDLKPDLVIRAAGELVVWDLTARSVAEHLAKTLLYARVLGEEGQLVRIGETYWRHFAGSRPFVPQQLYPAAMEAAAEQQRRARESSRRRAPSR